MAQVSGPITGENFTDQMWRDTFGAEPAIVGDVNGTSYRLTLPTSSNDAQLGSPSQDSIAIVGGKFHKIPLGETASLPIPASTHAAVGRTDLIVLRCDPTLAGDSPLGPIRLYRIAGTEGSAAEPTYDAAPPGVEDLPLYAITRKKDQSLNQAAVKDLRVRSGPTLMYRPGATFSTSTPLGTRTVRDGVAWRRDLSGTGAPEWVRETWFDNDGRMVGGVVPRARQEMPLPRSGWFTDYTPETVSNNIHATSGYFRHYGMNVPVKTFPRAMQVDTYLDLDFQAGNGWRVDIELADTGSDNKPGTGTVVASQVLGVPRGADGVRHDVYLSAGVTISANDARVVRVWVRRVGGNDGIASYDLGGYAFRAEWVEMSSGNDW